MEWTGGEILYSGTTYYLMVTLLPSDICFPGGGDENRGTAGAGYAVDLRRT